MAWSRRCTRRRMDCRTYAGARVCLRIGEKPSGVVFSCTVRTQSKSTMHAQESIKLQYWQKRPFPFYSEQNESQRSFVIP